MLRASRFPPRWIRGWWGVVFMLAAASGVSAIQAPVPEPPTHERQCVATGAIPAGDARRVTVAWTRPFATAKYEVIGSVCDSTNGDQSLELSHLIVPYTPQAASAIVFNRDTRAAHSGVLCLDASADATVAGDAPK